MDKTRRGLLGLLSMAAVPSAWAAPEPVLALSGARLPLPAAPGWSVTTAAGQALARRTLGAGQLEVTLAVRPHAAEDEPAFLRQVETRQEALMTADHDMRTMHFNQVRHKGAACMRWDGKFSPRGASGQPPLWRVGQACLHPMAPGLAVSAEAVWRAPEGADAEEALQVSQRLLADLEFLPIQASAGSGRPNAR